MSASPAVRKVAGEMLLGRPLLRNERLYFRDGDPTNLARDNLLVVQTKGADPFVCGVCGAARLCAAGRSPRDGRCKHCRAERITRDRQRVLALLRDPAFADWSDRQIARWVGVHFWIVGPLRRKLACARRDRRKYMRGDTEYTQAVGSRGKARRINIYAPEEESTDEEAAEKDVAETLREGDGGIGQGDGGALRPGE